MSILKETIIDLKAKYKTHGVKIRRLDEAIPDGSLEDLIDELVLHFIGNKFEDGDVEDALMQIKKEYSTVKGRESTRRQKG